MSEVFVIEKPTDTGMNDKCFLQVLDVIVLNCLDEGRRMYLSCKFRI